MTNKLLYVPLSLFTAFGLFSSTYAFTDTLEVNGINNNLMQSLTIDFNGAQETIWVGALKGNLNGNTSYFFCYDLNHTISVPNTYTATVLSPSSSSFPSNLLLPSSFNIQVATSMVNTAFHSFSTVNQYSGLQLAIWTVLYDWSPGVTPNLNTSNCSTGFCVPGASSSLISNANTYLAEARSFAASFPNGQSLGNWELLSSMDGSHINQVLIGMGAPEPQTYMILGSLLATTLCASQLRKMRQLM
jgi:hypothetical protein